MGFVPPPVRRLIPLEVKWPIIWLSSPGELLPVFKAALAVYFLAKHRDEIVIPIATSLNEAAGTDGIHRWNLILPSSARVSLLTYQTVIGVRYYELVKPLDGEYHFGRFFPGYSTRRGGFPPLFVGCTEV